MPPALEVDRAAAIPTAPEGSALRDVVRGGPGFVAVGFDGTDGTVVWLSRDGRTWTEAPQSSELDRAGMAAVTPVNGRLVGVGRDVASVEEELAAAWISEDGSTWQRTAGALEDGQMIDVASGGPGVVAVGSSVGLDAAAVWVSDDGDEWERIPHDPAFEHAFMWTITAGGPGLVAAGWRRTPEPSAAVWHSPDGRMWTRAPDLPDGEGFQIRAVTVAAGRLVAAGEGVETRGAAVWTSVDGASWVRSPDAENFSEAFINALVTIGSTIVAFGGVNDDAAIWVSSDSERWTPIVDEELADAYITAALHADGSIVAVGATQERIPNTQSYRQAASAWSIEVRSAR
ncbi:MAG: hypothetical protein ACRDGE_05970 [Candidatus Limnocylindria bacterium]